MILLRPWCCISYVLTYLLTTTTSVATYFRGQSGRLLVRCLQRRTSQGHWLLQGGWLCPPTSPPRVVASHSALLESARQQWVGTLRPLKGATVCHRTACFAECLTGCTPVVHHGTCASIICWAERNSCMVNSANLLLPPDDVSAWLPVFPVSCILYPCRTSKQIPTKRMQQQPGENISQPFGPILKPRNSITSIRHRKVQCLQVYIEPCRPVITSLCEST